MSAIMCSQFSLHPGSSLAAMELCGSIKVSFRPYISERHQDQGLPFYITGSHEGESYAFSWQMGLRSCVQLPAYSTLFSQEHGLNDDSGNDKFRY